MRILINHLLSCKLFYRDYSRTLFFLDKVSKIIKDEIRKMDCVPFEFNTIGVDDGIAMGHDGMFFSLPSRD